ncbi:MAG: methionyl-tRNA formyltransferase [Acidimicrobiaceae bacterium]|mgnify:FL=1|jgi:methionyl-tRNA formyltransferase|nr:methionyl-tRNA formyltransferase [Acidimicrobiaceae bacterium]HAB59095.1 methionyl-tRNA formyltransferase [Acidimicrobiaceae bacterium]
MSAAPPDVIRRIVYLGTPGLAVRPLRALVDAGYEIPLVVSRADARRGRGKQLLPSPVKAAALELGLPVADRLADLDQVEADLVVVVAYGHLIPEAMLGRLAFVNLHFSLLPRWRGAAPVERAILAGDATTGVCLMDLDIELDTGALYRRAETPICDDETLDELRGRLVEIGTDQLVRALADGFGDPEPQVGDPVYAAKIAAAERKIDWSQSAVAIHRRVRVGGAFTTWNGKRFKIHRTRLAAASDPGVVVSTPAGHLELLDVQPEGKPRMDAASWANGARWSADQAFGS